MRDMTRAAFRAALKRNGFRLELVWIRRPGSNMGVGIVTDMKGKLLRRETIRKAIRTFAEDDRKGTRPEVFQ